MSYQIPFPSSLLYPSNSLPPTLISLEDWALITLNGIDSIKYLHSQLTCDVFSLKLNHLKFAAHCNSKGKVISYLYVFFYKKSIALIGRRSVSNMHFEALKKYAVFSKTNIVMKNDIILLGIAGFKVQKILKKHFSIIPNAAYPVMHYQEATLIFFNLPIPRFIIIITQEIFDVIFCKLKDNVQLNNSMQWLSLDIEAGYPIIDINNSIKFIPQAVNIQALGGINFNKGCYIGQEIIARAEYHGTNKNTLYWLAGKAKHTPKIGDSLELKIGSNWRRTGTVLATCQVNNNIVWIQAVMNNNLGVNSKLRLCTDITSELFICNLSYIVNK